MTTISLRFLGAAECSVDGHPVVLRAAKTTALLAYLAVTRAPQRREHLIDLLWPDSAPDAARKNLRNTLWSIRKALGDGALSYPDAVRIGLSDLVWSDVQAFEVATRLAQAQAGQAAGDLYRGPLLDGLALPAGDAPDFELWLTTERERFGQLYLRHLESLIAAHRATADWHGVIGLAQRALAEDDLQEPVYRSLMEAHARLGERVEALRQYDRLRSALSRELDVEPLPETEALRSAILTSNLPPIETVTQRARPGPSEFHRPRLTPAARASPVPFVGRQEELAALDQEYRRVVKGEVRAVLITGELGIGKSRLWQEWSIRLPSGPTLLDTRCMEPTQSLPFAPLTRLFRRQPCFECLFGSPTAVSPLWLAELTRLLPEIRQNWPGIPEPPALPPEEERRRLFEAFSQLLRALEAWPLVLFIDDLHWADAATLDWLAYLADRMAGQPLLLIGAYRPDDAPAQLIRLAAGWHREGLARQLQLARLTREETAQLIAALRAGPEDALSLETRSAGNPYFLLELSRVGPGETPPGLAELLRTRLQRLPEAAQQVVQAAAVLEVDTDFRFLRRTSGRGEEETLAALETLQHAGVLLEREGGYEFAHPLVATVVRQDLTSARSRVLHRRAAHALEAAYVGQLEQVAGQLARHYVQADSPPQAARYAQLAAERALRLAAPAEAVAFYRQAVTLEPTPNRRMGLGRALATLGDLKNARLALNQALDEFAAEGDQAGTVQAMLALAESYLPSGRGDQVIYWAEQACAGLEPQPGQQPDAEALASAHYLLGAGNLQQGDSLTRAEAHLAMAAELATQKNLPEIAARSQFELGNLLAQRGDLEHAVHAFRTSIALAHSAGAHFLEVLGHNNLAYHAHLHGDMDTARVHVGIGLKQSQALELSLPRQYLYSTRGEIALAEGMYAEADLWLARALAEADRNGNEAQCANIRANLGRVAWARGNLDEALLLLESARNEATSGGLYLQIQIDLWLSELHLERGERTAAAEALGWAEGGLVGRERKGLEQRAQTLRSKLRR